MVIIKKSLPTILAASILTISSFQMVSAQSSSTSPGSSSASSSSPGSMADTAFIAKNIRDNQMEIELNQLGLQRSGNQMIKAAAQQMIADHSQMLADLRRVGTKNNMAG